MTKAEANKTTESTLPTTEIQNLVSEVIKGLSGPTKICRTASLWTENQLQILQSSKKYLYLVERYGSECVNSNGYCDSNRTIQAMYQLLRELFPEISWADIVSKVVSDTIRAHIKGIIANTRVREWALHTECSQTPYRTSGYENQDSIGTIREMHEVGNDVDKQQANKTQRNDGTAYHIVSCGLQDLGWGLIWAQCGERSETVYLLVDKDNVAVDVSSDRAELERIQSRLRA